MIIVIVVQWVAVAYLLAGAFQTAVMAYVLRLLRLHAPQSYAEMVEMGMRPGLALYGRGIVGWPVLSGSFSRAAVRVARNWP